MLTTYYKTAEPEELAAAALGTSAPAHQCRSNNTIFHRLRQLDLRQHPPSSEISSSMRPHSPGFVVQALLRLSPRPRNSRAVRPLGVGTVSHSAPAGDQAHVRLPLLGPPAHSREPPQQWIATNLYMIRRNPDRFQHDTYTYAVVGRGDRKMKPSISSRPRVLAGRMPYGHKGGCRAALNSRNDACLFSILFRDLTASSVH
jgi:hypothetical protein